MVSLGEAQQLGDPPAVADLLQKRIGMSAFSMLRCLNPVLAPTDLFAQNSRVSAARVQASVPELVPLLERELEPFAAAVRSQRSYDVADRFPQDAVRRSEVFNDYWRPFGVERQLVGHLAAGQDFLGFLCVARSARESAFTASDLGAFEAVRAGVERELAATRRLGTGLEDALAVLSEATLEAWLLFDSAGRLLWLTDEARTRLSLDAVRVGSSLALRHSPALERLRAWVRSQARAGAVPAPPVLRLSRLPEELVMRQFEPRPGQRLFLVGFQGGSAPRRAGAGEVSSAGEEVAQRAARLASRHSLTPRQAEVLAHLAWGKSNKVIAAALGCAESTVEVHVTALLAKLGCASRAEAVARFWTA